MKEKEKEMEKEQGKEMKEKEQEKEREREGGRGPDPGDTVGCFWPKAPSRGGNEGGDPAEAALGSQGGQPGA